MVLLFEGPLLLQISEEQGEIFTLLTEILVGGVTFSIPTGAEFAAFASFAAFTTCLTFVWFPSVNRVKRSISIVSIVCFPSVVRFVWNA